MTNITPLDFEGGRRDPDRRVSLRPFDQDTEPYLGVGTELAAERRRAGRNILHIAERLNIRHEHLTAIEEGRFDDLPARVYAVGFIRSYAGYLGLDPTVAVQAFKHESDLSTERSPLVFPIAEPSERMPKTWLVGVSVVLVAAVFALWAVPKGLDLARESRVPPPPIMVNAAPAAVAGDGLAEIEVADRPAPESPLPPPPALEPAPQDAGGLDPAIGRGLRAPPQPAPAERVAEENAAVPLPAEPPEGELVDEPVVAAPAPDRGLGAAPGALAPEIRAVLETPPAPGQAAIADAAPAEGAGVAPPAAGGAGEVEVAGLAPPPAVPNAPPPPAGAAAAVAEPRIFGADNVGARVIIVARQDSWVQVTGEAGQLLLTRILRSGDTYRAPDRDDLVMMTGNAGALEITVDGTVVPALGPLGSVRRNVSLDPDVLLARAAGR